MARTARTALKSPARSRDIGVRPRVAATLVRPAAVAYWSALRHWNLTDQVPRTVFVQTTARPFRIERTVLGVQYRIVTVSPRKFFGLAQGVVGGHNFGVTDREKTLIDCVDRPDLAGGMAEIVSAIHRVTEGEDGLAWETLDKYLARFPNRAAVKRLGFLVTALGIAIPDRARRLARWQGLVSTGVALLDPGNQSRVRRTDRTWQIAVNVDERAFTSNGD